MTSGKTKIRTLVVEGIARGHYQPGAWLKVSELAALAQLSPIPVRETLALMVGQDILEERRGIGFMIPRRAPHELEQIYRLRALLAAAALLPASASAGRGDMVGGRFSDCFWHYGAFGVHDFNIAYPDAGATYWAAGFRRPPGSKLTLRGRYPHSRYMAMQTYDVLGHGVDALADYQIDPLPGFDESVPEGREANNARAELPD